MSAAYALRELALADLEGIWVYTVEQWGVEQAERYLKSLFACFEDLAENPQLGSQRNEVQRWPADFRNDMRVTGLQTASNRRFQPWPLRLSGDQARPDRAARRGFCHWSFFDQAAQAASIQRGGIPDLDLTRRCRETAKEGNNTIIKSAPSGACWSAPIQVPTGSTGVAC